MGAAFRTLARAASGTAGESRFLPLVGMTSLDNNLRYQILEMGGLPLLRAFPYAAVNRIGSRLVMTRVCS